MWRALNSKQHPLAENPRRARKQWYNRAEITGKEKICTFLTKAHSWNFKSTARWWRSQIVLSSSCWLSLACFFPHLHGGHSASCLRIHYLFVYRPQLPAPALDVIWAVFFSYSLFSMSSYCSPILFLAQNFSRHFFFFSFNAFQSFHSSCCLFHHAEIAKQKFIFFHTFTLHVEQHRRRVCHNTCVTKLLKVEWFFLRLIWNTKCRTFIQEECVDSWILVLKSSFIFIWTLIQYFLWHIIFSYWQSIHMDIFSAASLLDFAVFLFTIVF